MHQGMEILFHLDFLGATFSILISNMDIGYVRLCEVGLHVPAHGDCHAHQGGRGEQGDDVLHHLLEVRDVICTVQLWCLQGMQIGHQTAINYKVQHKTEDDCC